VAATMSADVASLGIAARATPPAAWQVPMQVHDSSCASECSPWAACRSHGGSVASSPSCGRSPPRCSCAGCSCPGCSCPAGGWCDESVSAPGCSWPWAPAAASWIGQTCAPKPSSTPPRRKRTARTKAETRRGNLLITIHTVRCGSPSSHQGDYAHSYRYTIRQTYTLVRGDPLRLQHTLPLARQRGPEGERRLTASADGTSRRTGGARLPGRSPAPRCRSPRCSSRTRADRHR
jgi:hypothetical protein